MNLREIDVLVAEKIFGLPVCDGKVLGYHLGLGEGEPRHYSSDIAARPLVTKV